MPTPINAYVSVLKQPKPRGKKTKILNKERKKFISGLKYNPKSNFKAAGLLIATWNESWLGSAVNFPFDT